jgi:hypothetical protein
MVHADLHVHTTRSDGSLAPEEVLPAAREAGLGAVAITDHDRLHSDLAPVEDRRDVTLVHGIELRVAADCGRVDLLGYGVDPTPALRAELDRIQRNRVERAHAIAECLEDRLGVVLDVDFEAGIGRPHLARAVAAHPDLEYAVGEVFEAFIGADGPCYVAREIPDFERGAALLAEACAVTGLAHPLRYADPAAALDLAASLDAVEVVYPYDDAPDAGADTDLVAAAAETHGLLATGGSDAHGRTVGTTGLSRADFRPVAAALDLPVP